MTFQTTLWPPDDAYDTGEIRYGIGVSFNLEMALSLAFHQLGKNSMADVTIHIKRGWFRWHVMVTGVQTRSIQNAESRKEILKSLMTFPDFEKNLEGLWTG